MLLNTVKLKFGPFWLSTSILLVKIKPSDPRTTTYVLRVDRPGICGGDIVLPIGRQGFPIFLLPRSDTDRQQLKFTLCYGLNGKKLRFLASSAEVYSHWITVLPKALIGGGKTFKPIRHKTGKRTASVWERIDHSNSGSKQQHTSVSSCKSLYHRGVVETGGRFATCEVAKAEIAAISDGCGRHKSPLDRAFAPPIPLSVSSPPSEAAMQRICVQQKVFCVAIDHDDTAIFAAYVPPQDAPARSELLFKLSREQWARWIRRDLHDGDRSPEVYRLTSTSCNRLELNEVQSIVQPYHV